MIKEENPKEMPLRKHRMKGCLLAQTVGDALGSYYEFQDIIHPSEITPKQLSTQLPMKGGWGGIPPKDMKNSSRLLDGQWTDDASQGFCLAEVLMTMDPETREFPALSFMNILHDWWFGSCRNSGLNESVGLGGTISTALANWDVRLKQVKQKAVHKKTGKKKLVPSNPANFTASRPAMKRNTRVDGNGSTMRCAAAGIFAISKEEAIKFGYEQSIVTTRGEESAGCAGLLAYLCYQAINSSIQDPKELKDWLLSKDNLNNFLIDFSKQILPKPLLFEVKGKVDLPDLVKLLCVPEDAIGEESFLNWRVSPENYKFNLKQKDLSYYGSYVTEGMALALNVLHTTNSLEEGLKKIAQMRGDADSNAAVLGQLAGAIYGYKEIPDDWLDKVNHHNLNINNPARLAEVKNRGDKFDLLSAEGEVVPLFEGTPVQFVKQAVKKAIELEQKAKDSAKKEQNIPLDDKQLIDELTQILTDKEFNPDNKENIDSVTNLIIQLKDINVKNEAGETALNMACQAGHIKIVNLLICRQEVRLNVSGSGSSGKTALHYACEKGYTQLVQIAKSKGEFLLNQDNDGNTPLHLACLNGMPETAAALIISGANTELVNNAKQSAFSICFSRNFYNDNELKKLLYQNREKENVRRLKYNVGCRFDSYENPKVCFTFFSRTFLKPYKTDLRYYISKFEKPQTNNISEVKTMFQDMRSEWKDENVDSISKCFVLVYRQRDFVWKYKRGYIGVSAMYSRLNSVKKTLAEGYPEHYQGYKLIHKALANYLKGFNRTFTEEDLYGKKDKPGIAEKILTALQDEYDSTKLDLSAEKLKALFSETSELMQLINAQRNENREKNAGKESAMKETLQKLKTDLVSMDKKNQSKIQEKNSLNISTPVNQKSISRRNSLLEQEESSKPSDRLLDQSSNKDDKITIILS